MLALRAVIRRTRRAKQDVSGQLGMLQDMPGWVVRTTTATAMSRVQGRLSMLDFLTAFVVASALAMSTMGLLWLMFAVSAVPRSEQAAVVAFYTSAACEAGSLLPRAPYQAAAVEAHGSCYAITMGGKTAGNLYGRGECHEDGTASLALSYRLQDCKGGTMSRLPIGECISLRLGPSEEVYVRVGCSLLTAAKAQVEALSRLNAHRPQADDTTTNVTVTRESLHIDGAPTDADSIPSPYFAGYQRLQSTSHDSETIASTAGWPSDVAPREVILQTALAFNETTDDGDREAATVASTVIETQRNFSTLQRLAWRDLRLLPFGWKTEKAAEERNAQDAPIGFTMNQFGNAASERSGALASRGAQRYVGIRGGALDVGRFFSEAASGDEEAVSVSMWLRVSERTLGCAFAVADLYEVQGASPVVERLMELAMDGPTTGQPWFEHDLRVYAALFVDGRSRSFTFASMRPVSSGGGGEAREEAVVLRRWSLDDMGHGYVFNGAWQHVVLSLQNENGAPFATLSINGVTSTISGNWRKCLPRRLEPVRRLTESSVRVDVAPLSATVGGDGVLYVGYLNGAVGQLRIAPRYTGPSETMRGQSTGPMRSRYGLRRTSLTLLAVSMLLAVVVAFATIAYRLRWKLVEQRAAEAEAMEAAQASYEQEATRGALYGFGRYAALPFESLREWVGPAADAFALSELLEECRMRDEVAVRAKTAKAVPTLVRVLGRLQTGADTAPSADAWSALLDKMGVCVAPTAVFVAKGYDGDDGDVEAAEPTDQFPACAVSRLSWARSRTSFHGGPPLSRHSLRSAWISPMGAVTTTMTTRRWPSSDPA
jgi:hypothetical protein